MTSVPSGAYAVALFERLDAVTNSGNLADDLVAGDHGATRFIVSCWSRFVVRLCANHKPSPIPLC